MLYNTTLILLHRPYLSHHSENEAAREKTKHPSESSRKIATDAAVLICNCVELYRCYYSLGRVNACIVYMIVTAGLMHADNWCYLPAEDAGRFQELHISCIQALGELGKTIRSSIRGLDLLTIVRREWLDMGLTYGT